MKRTYIQPKAENLQIELHDGMLIGTSEGKATTTDSSNPDAPLIMDAREETLWEDDFEW